MLRQLDTDLWVTERPLRFFGAELATRMTTIRLADGGLLVHSSVCLDEATKGFATLRAVVEHYDTIFERGLTEQDKVDLVKYLKSL